VIESFERHFDVISFPDGSRKAKCRLRLVSEFLRFCSRQRAFGVHIFVRKTYIPCSRNNPEFLWVNDAEVVRDLIAISAPVSGTSSRRKVSIAVQKSL